MADNLAGEAINLPDPNPTTMSIAYLKRKVRENTLQEWQHRFLETERNTEYTGTPSLSLPKEYRPNFRKNYKAHRDTTTILVHLRTGHGYFKSYFERFNIPFNNYKCECGHTRQDRSHLLLQCSAYNDQRRTHIPADPNKPWTAHTLLHTKEGTKKVLAFTTATEVGTRRWFTRAEDDDDPLPGTQEQENRNLNLGLGRLTHAGTEPGGDSEDEDGLLMNPVEDFERRKEARGVECFHELYEVLRRNEAQGDDDESSLAPA